MVIIQNNADQYSDWATGWITNLIVGEFWPGARDFFTLQSVWTSSGAHAASYLVTIWDIPW